MSAISVQHIAKQYKLGQLTSLRDSLFNLWARLLNRPLRVRQDFYALKDTSFVIETGEVVGIIGTNGAGKSTLLKILAGITKPSHGNLVVNGTIAPLIEVSAGLVNDLTGRENIFLNGSILGMPRKIISGLVDEIVEFAELRDFIDTPVKRYSSGMRVRLGFAIATSVDPDILIVDEVLAVGDLAFQRKCFRRIERLIKDQHKTVLLVSHNIRQVERLCSRVILLDQGRVLKDGNARDVCNLFYSRSNDKVLEQTKRDLDSFATIKTSGELEVLEIQTLDANNQIAEEIISGSELRIRVRFLLKEALEQPEIVVGTHTTDFIYLTAESTMPFANRPDLLPGEHVIEHRIFDLPLAPGVYCIRFMVRDLSRQQIYHGETLKMFQVAPNCDEAYDLELRTLHVNSEWYLEDQVFSTVDCSSRAISG